MDFVFNPIIVSVVLLCVLCVLRVNVLLAIIVSSIAAGLCGGMSIEKIMNTFIFPACSAPNIPFSDAHKPSALRSVRAACGSEIPAAEDTARRRLPASRLLH